MNVRRFPYYQQHDYNDCGHTCLRMIARHYGKSISLAWLKKQSDISFIGLSLSSLSQLAEKIHFKSLVIKTDYAQLAEEVPLPCIAYWKQNHFVVIYKITKNKVHVADPAYGLLNFTKNEFITYWIGKSTADNQGLLLLLEPTLQFYNNEEETEPFRPGLQILAQYIKTYRKLLVQLFLGVIAGSLLQLLFPLLTQAMVDIGINNRDTEFIYLLLLAQLMLFVGRTSVEFIKNWIILYLGTRVNISIISDFLIKIMKLPVSFFEGKHMGNLLQRISDHDRIEHFLNTTIIEILFAITTLVVFGGIIAIYSISIFIVFVLGSSLYFLWILIFLKKRRQLDYKRFNESGANTATLIELFTGMQEIKLNGAELLKRWKWERIQARLYKVNIKSLGLKQTQEGGSLFINEIKNICITFLAAKQVVQGEITLGMMLALSYIIGQLNGPILQLIGMIRSYQDAKIALERISEIHTHSEEETQQNSKTAFLPANASISIRNLYFKYEGNYNEYILNDLSFDIPYGQTTAIVGASGSGKTTLLKILLKFYNSTTGDIKVGGIKIENISARAWRKKAGAVMQDGYIFSDTVAQNIAVGEENINYEKLQHALHMANIDELVQSLPLGYNTLIGRDGAGMSVGQKQRILIARAIYKDPEFVFFDEATSSLDANNEKVIMHNLTQFLKGKTALIIAHRLSTVKNADQIVVLDKGRIIEQGTHQQLTSLKSAYYHLVKNQLELGN